MDFNKRVEKIVTKMVDELGLSSETFDTDGDVAIEAIVRDATIEIQSEVAGNTLAIQNIYNKITRCCRSSLAARGYL